jgi:TRAP-type C4-dicarboxylate transport system substrate-binding protein
MTDDQRKVVQETLNDASIQHRARLAKSMDDLTATLKAKGMQIAQPDRKAFRDIMWPQATRPFLVKAWGEDLTKKVEALAD